MRIATNVRLLLRLQSVSLLINSYGKSRYKLPVSPIRVSVDEQDIEEPRVRAKLVRLEHNAMDSNRSAPEQKAHSANCGS